MPGMLALTLPLCISSDAIITVEVSILGRTCVPATLDFPQASLCCSFQPNIALTEQQKQGSGHAEVWVPIFQINRNNIKIIFNMSTQGNDFHKWFSTTW